MAPPSRSCFTSLLLLLTIISSSAKAPSHDYRCNLEDKKALLQIGKDLGFSGSSSWNAYTHGCCAWRGVACDFNGRVNNLYINAVDRPITIPASITDLRFLTTLQFNKNPNLTGPIPPVVGQLTKLTFLRLDWNAFSGPIPNFLSNLTSLTYLSLAFNQLSGTIPSFLADLPLTFIRLDRNRLTGPIPASLAKTSSTGLFFSHNNLTGPIPSSFANTTILQSIDFSRNRLYGDASFLFGANKAWTDIDLSRNRFKFDLTKVVFPQNLSTLDLNHNKVYGSIPKQIAKLSELYGFNVSYNRLCGEIPAGGQLGHDGIFDQYSYVHNKCLCGTPLAACKKN